MKRFSPTFAVRGLLASVFLAVALTCGVAVIGPVASSGAQTAPVDVNPNDFIDPQTGQFDLEGYLAAVAAANARRNGNAGGTNTGRLPTTGASSIDFAGLGITCIAVGGAALWVGRRTRRDDKVLDVDTPAVS